MSEEQRIAAGNLPPLAWLEVANPNARLGRVRYALFDFDGTLSVIRRGWEKVMVGLMVEMICDGRPPAPEIEAKVAQYVDESTGILTISQMKWLEAAVHRYGLARAPRTAREYKRLYNERLLQPVRERLALLDGVPAAQESFLIAGARDFLAGLAERGARLFLASGTDQEYVETEAAALELVVFFGTHIYGARGDSETDSKEMVIRRILADHRLKGEELLVVGDGPVEMRCARQSGALALGVAADEEDRRSLDPRKRRRLLAAGADLLVANFLHARMLVELVCGGL